MKYNKNDLLTSITGFLMACADSVPGVSGGTIAYILGKYDEFLGSIATLTSSSTKQEKINALVFLIKLGIGWIIGIGLATTLITSLVETQIHLLSSMFIGFILLSLPFIYREEKNVIKGKYHHSIFMLLGIILVVGVTIFSNNSINVYDPNNQVMTLLYIFLSGILAITAMVLPGISGSTFMLILGLYVPIITAVKNIFKLNFDQLDIVLTFGLGAVVGIVFVSRLLRYLLKEHRSKIIFFIFGLMFGSLYAIVLGPTSIVDSTTQQNLGLEMLNFSNFNIFAFIIGGIIIVALEQIKLKFKGE